MTFHFNKSLDEKYEIVHEIKKGGFGIVYYGLDKKLNKPVAIKEIAPNLLDDPKYLDMFQEEALNIAKLSHNNIVHIYELKKTSDRHLFIIMEYIDGIDLEKVVRFTKKANKRIPPHLAVYIVAEVCMALDYAHQRRDAFTNKPLNLVHQDISPSNIMISRYGGVKLIDFGIASVRRHHKEKRDNKLRGKIPYMAPEQLIMGNHPDHRSDLFSLGLVLYETITGERLFSSQEELIAAGKNPKWFKKALKGKKIPNALVKILFKSLEIDLSKRYQSANHMYIDLLQYLISCNETGELMDHLAEFLSEQFENTRLPLTPTNYTPTSYNNFTTPGTIGENPPQSFSSSDFVSNPWEDANIKPDSEPLSPAYKPSLPEEPKIEQPLQTPQRFPTNFVTVELDDEGEEDLKTVIDVIRISARNNKKRLMQISTGILMAILTFGVLDIFNRWTPAGIWMYDLLFPPAIEIMTVPENAQIYLDGKEIEGRSPVSIDKIAPGVHKLELSLEGYKPIVKSLFVPRDGAVQVQGESKNNGTNNRSYLFRFSTEIEINSIPKNAQVYINGIRFNQRTPCKISWEIGTPFSIELEYAGFERLTGYSLNTIQGYDEVEDRRLWDLTVFNDSYTKYSITGTFRKEVSIETVPSGAKIVDVKTDQPIGVAEKGTRFILMAGSHELELRKGNFIPKKITLNIDEKFNEKVRAVLSRTVSFSAIDEIESDRRDIGATVISLKNNDREYLRTGRRTPFELTLPAYAYTAVFTKPGYQRAQVRIEPEDQDVQAEMAPSKSIIEIDVLDALTNEPITGAEIFYNFAENPQTLDSFFDQTDLKGEGFGQLVAGRYVFKIKKPGYNGLSRSVVTRAGESHNFVFKIFPN